MRATDFAWGLTDMAADQELQRHIDTWEGFTLLLKVSLAVIVLLLAGMAYFLL